MIGTRLSIRVDLPTGDRIGPGKIGLLEAIRLEGSISAAARHLGMSYRRAWLLVEELDDALQHPVVAARSGGGGGAVVTPLGVQVIELYRTIEDHVRTSADQEFRAISKLVRRRRRAGDYHTRGVR
jgi:molybdate transport system regulatory protein